MHLYFLRHGQADWPDWRGSDDDRPLNEAGAEETLQVAEGLKRLRAVPDLILTSPLPRAVQTAKIASVELDVKMLDDEALSPGCTLKKLRHILERHAKAKSVMVVGHEPDFSQLIEGLTGAKVKLAKSGVALLEVEAERLLWLFPPKVIAAFL